MDFNFFTLSSITNHRVSCVLERNRGKMFWQSLNEKYYNERYNFNISPLIFHSWHIWIFQNSFFHLKRQREMSTIKKLMWRISNLSACQMFTRRHRNWLLSPFSGMSLWRTSEWTYHIYILLSEIVVDFFFSCCCWSRDMKIFIIKNSRAHQGIFLVIFFIFIICVDGSSERISTQLMNFSSHLWTLFSLHNHRHLWVNATWLMKIFRD